MSDCPLADDCPSFSERIQGMGCQHYGDRGGAEWCNHYNQPISDLKSQPVQPGEEVIVEVDDIHESGAGVGRTGDGFIVMVDGMLPPAKAKVKVTKVRSNHARAEELERLELEDEEEADDEEIATADVDGSSSDGDDDADDTDESDDGGPDRERLGSRDNFWGS